ncbi:MAG: helix-turn-helix domain-containing protein [Eubacteriales bacterium]|nr:helix-turn-helix domain-containing protein [Eubacteriales bacterium]
MKNTKKNILITALRLFARNGYDAVSVSQIAGELGMTKGALYKHFKSKRDIFDSIFAYVCQLDMERSRKTGVPEKEFSEMPESFSDVSPESLKTYMTSQFYYWSEDETACNFRKMLTLEQYKTVEMNDLYQKVMTSGPLNYIEHLLCEMMKDKEQIPHSSRQMAVEFYAPFHLLLSISDAVPQKEEKEKLAEEYVRYMDQFFEKYALIPEQKNRKETI